jgi:hypothetical protein
MQAWSWEITTDPNAAGWKPEHARGISRQTIHGQDDAQRDPGEEIKTAHRLTGPAGLLGRDGMIARVS